MNKEEDKEEDHYLKSVRELIKNLEENQIALDSNQKISKKDYRKYVADLNFSMLEIFKKLEKSIADSIENIDNSKIPKLYI